ncbi:MAG TPA: PAS domain S-box protein [Terriglobales bacterium]|nr:PAS domain S-box protein [Terriglobales bacterium]
MVESVSKATILCVDDEPGALYFRKLILERQGYTVLTATSAEEGLTAFRKHHVDLVVTDHLLGRDTGTQMAAEIRRLNPGIPIVLLSGTSDIPEGMEHADVFLSKTEGPQRMLDQVAALIEKGGRHGHEAHLKEDQIFTSESGALQKLLAAIVEGSDDAIFSKTLNGTIMSWNRAAERMYGYTSEEMIGKPVSILLPPDRPNEVRDILEKLRRGERLQHFQTTRVTKDGRVLDVALTISPIQDDRGNIVGASTVARDITRIRMAEEALRNSEKLAIAGRMAATVAHEINNPLEAVTNILYILEQTAELDASSRKLVQAAQDELRRISQISRLTLGFYRTADNKRTKVQIPDLIENVLTLYQRKVGSLQVSVQKKYEGTSWVLGDFGELRQVFSNLIVNAIEALGKTGNKLMIHIFDSVDWTDPLRRGVRTVIVDNGPGIGPEHRSRLFEPFYTTKGESGTGIGLWVSRGIVQKHGGKLRFRSSTNPNRSGTCFSVFLPFSNASAG